MKPCAVPGSAALRNASAKRAAHLLERVARQTRLCCDALKRSAHQRGAFRLDAAPAPQGRHEPRGGLRVDRVEGEDEVGDKAIPFPRRGMEPMRSAGEGHVEATHAV